jgi:hypothetical protein
LDGGVVADIAGVVAVELVVLLAEPGFDSAQGCPGAGQMFALLRRPTSVRLVEAALSVVLLALAFVCESLARLGVAVAVVAAALAFVGGSIATVGCGVARIGLRTVGMLCVFGGTAFARGVLALHRGGALAALLRLAVKRSGLAMELREVGIDFFVDQPLASFGGGAFSAGRFAGAVADLLSTLGALTMLVGGCAGHARTVLPSFLGYYVLPAEPG